MRQYLLIIVFLKIQYMSPGNAFEEKDIECYVQRKSSHSGMYYSSWSDSRSRYGEDTSPRMQSFSSLKLCDGNKDCMNGDDEREEMCDKNIQISGIHVEEQKATSVQLVWNTYYSSKPPHGFLITRKVDDRVVSTRLKNSTLRRHRLGNLMPLQHYTVIMRPFVNSSNGNFKVGPPVTVSGDTTRLEDLEVHPAPDGFEGTSIPCLDMLFRTRNIAVGSSAICNEVQDCLQGVDEMKEMCGNTLHFTLAAKHTGTTKVILEWQLQDQGTSSATSMEEQRALIYGDRQGPDGLFLAIRSRREFFTPKLHDPNGRQVTVSGLNSSTNYTFLLRPYLTSEDARWGYRFGKVAALSLRTKTAEPQNVTISYVTRDTAVLRWSPARDAKFFRVKGTNKNWTIQGFPSEGHNTEGHTTHSFLVPVTSPNSAYCIEACAGQECSDPVLVRAGGQRNETTLSPKISWVAATGPTSASVKWTVSEAIYEKRSFPVADGFTVRFCEVNAIACHVAEVTSKNCTFEDLKEGTTYEIHIQPKMKTRTGRVEVGTAENARISTWTWAPAMPKLEAHHAVGYTYHLHVNWTFYNSTVSYIQVNTDHGMWNNCTESSSCSALIHLDETVPPFTIMGSLMLWNLQSYKTYYVSVRGCNIHGCGTDNSFVITTPMEAPSAPNCITVSECGNNTTLVQWEKPLQPGGPLDGYELTWKCDGMSSMGTRVTDVKYVIQESLTDGNCALSLLGYHVTWNGNLLRGAEANFTLSGNHIPNVCATKTNLHTTDCPSNSTSY